MGPQNYSRQDSPLCNPPISLSQSPMAHPVYPAWPVLLIRFLCGSVVPFCYSFFPIGTRSSVPPGLNDPKQQVLAEKEMRITRLTLMYRRRLSPGPAVVLPFHFRLVFSPQPVNCSHHLLPFPSQSCHSGLPTLRPTPSRHPNLRLRQLHDIDRDFGEDPGDRQEQSAPARI